MCFRVYTSSVFCSATAQHDLSQTKNVPYSPVLNERQPPCSQGALTPQNIFLNDFLPVLRYIYSKTWVLRTTIFSTTCISGKLIICQALPKGPLTQTLPQFCKLSEKHLVLQRRRLRLQETSEDARLTPN